ncbi:hypothetical protein C1H46_031432 [Malus baccata]|uniref:Uncharacterized protein n=1 Tax=Malus baccata TaxID=106549 RepID=A0A540L9K2_MALBA|nr:hypothetical protein C1H46_031432 [Malus baccata]
MEESSDLKYFDDTKSDYDIRMEKYDYLVVASWFSVEEEQMMQRIRNSLKKDFQTMCDEDDDDTNSKHSECKRRKAMVKKNKIKKGT